LLLQILNSISDPIFVKYSQHIWVFLNDAFCDFIGHKQDALIGKTDYDFFPKSMLKNIAKTYLNSGLTQLAQSVSARLRRAINTQSGTSYIMLGA
jgi:PAS domain S-box-containing protein